MKKLKWAFNILKATGAAFSEDNALKLSASLSYYTIFAIGPLLIIIISLAGIYYGNDAVRGELYHQINDLVGNQAALQIQDIISSARKTHATTTGAVIGFIILFVGASGVFTEMQSSINFIWSVKAKPKKGWLKFVINRLLSFSLVIGLGFLLLVSLIINAAVNVLSTKLTQLLSNYTVYFINILNISIILIVITCLFAVIYKVLPDAIISWRDAMIGAAFTAVLFLIGKFAIGFYLGRANMGVTYGTAASIVIILTWVYYSSLILYFGAEFTKIYALHSGHGIKPKDTAVFVVKQEAKEIVRSRLEM